MTPAELAAYGMSEDAWAESLAGRHNRQAIRDHAPAASNREARQHRLAERLARAEALEERIAHTESLAAKALDRKAGHSCTTTSPSIGQTATHAGG